VQATVKEVVAHSVWQQARTAVLAAVDQDDAAVIFGAAGTGKTLLLQDLVRTLGQRGQPARLVGPADLLDPAFKSHILVVDEAELIPAERLAALCVRDTPFVLAARPEFADRLADLPRAIATVQLRPLSAVEVAHFVATRLSAAGRSRDLLEPEAVLALAVHSRGVPRRLNVLAAAAVCQAEMEGAASVSRRHVNTAAAVRADPIAGAPEVLLRRAEKVRSIPARPATHSVPTAPVLTVSTPAWQRPRGALQASAIGLSLLAAVGLAVSGWRKDQPPPAPPNTSVAAGEPSRTDGDQSAPVFSGRVVEAPSEEAGMEAKEPRPETEPSGEKPADAPQQDSPPLRPSGAISRPKGVASEIPATFRGTVFNETMHQSGQMSLAIRTRAPPGAIAARFEAWGGLLGSGELLGTLSEDGRIFASGQLMMGKNPFTCTLSGVVKGDTVVGSATFVREGGTGTARSVFTLTKS
jgi:hypothetical protein